MFIAPDQQEILDITAEFTLDEDALCRLLHCRRQGRPYLRSLELYKQNSNLFCPAYALRRVAITDRYEEGVVIANICLRSKILARLLQKVQFVYIYLATAGAATRQLADNYDDFLDQYLLDQLAYLAYLQAMDKLDIAAEQLFTGRKYSRLCPGTLADWDVAEVKKLFVLMDGLYQALGMEVKDSGLMLPLKSATGLLFLNEEEFNNCSFCPCVNCSDRQAEFTYKIE